MLAKASDVLNQLVAMSCRLGEPQREFVILGEGNTSARVDDETFWVKASGVQLDGIAADGFVRVRFEPVLALLEAEDVSDDDVGRTLAEAAVGENNARPSVETFMHAVLLKQLEDLQFIGHTHPVHLNAILCSRQAEEIVQHRLFPDEVVCCGVAPCWIPFTDPGVKLARRIRQGVADYIQTHGARPRAILMQNHGLIALGATPAEVESITAMWVKVAKVTAGTFHFGGPRYLTPEQVSALAAREDSKYRRSIISGDGQE